MPEDEANMQRENAQLKRDLEFSTSEIERLRAKLIVEEMPPLIEDLKWNRPGNNNRDASLGPLPRDLSIGDLQDPSGAAGGEKSNEITSIKESLLPGNLDVSGHQSRNQQAHGVRQYNTAGNGNAKPVPKLDFKKLKKVQEFKDWYSYACKLEDSVKYLRDRMKSLESDHD